MTTKSQYVLISIVVLILVGPVVLLISYMRPTVHYDKQYELVDVNDDVIELLYDGASDSVFKRAVEDSSKRVDNIYGLNGSLLWYAVHHNRYSLAKWLVQEKGADPNGGRGSSPLAEAARQGNDKMVQLLLSHGGNPVHEFRDGISAEWIARHHEKEEIIQIFKRWETEKPTKDIRRNEKATSKPSK